MDVTILWKGYIDGGIVMTLKERRIRLFLKMIELEGDCTVEEYHRYARTIVPATGLICIYCPFGYRGNVEKLNAKGYDCYVNDILKNAKEIVERRYSKGEIVEALL